MSDSTLTPLLNACKQDPTHDTPRLAVADWLEQHGQPERAEFVRLELALHDEADHAYQPGAAAQEARQARLAKKHLAAWTTAFPNPSNRYWFQFEENADENDDEEAGGPRGKFLRGMILLSCAPGEVCDVVTSLPEAERSWFEKLELHGLAATDDLDALFARDETHVFTALSLSWQDERPTSIDWLDRPSIRDLSIMDDEGTGALLRRIAEARELRPHHLYVSVDPEDPGGWEALIGSAVMTEVRSLECGLETDAPILQSLANASHLSRLSRLFLSGDHFPPEAMRALFHSPVVAELESLNVGGYSGAITGIAAALSASKVMRKLRVLDLSFNTVDDGEAAMLARSPVLEQVESLNFGSGSLTAPGLQALAGSPYLQMLQSLDLSGTSVGDVGVSALANSPYVRKLRVLSVCRCDLTEKGIQALVRSSNLSGLESLDLSLNPLPDNALNALARSGHLGNLRCLQLRGLRISADTFARLLNSPIMKQVEELDLQGTPLSSAHVRILASAPLPGLRKIILHKNGLPAGDADVLMDACWLPQVIDLHLDNLGLTNAGITRLTTRLQPSNVAFLNLAGNRIDDAGADRLLQWPGIAELADLSLYDNKIPAELEQRLMRSICTS